ncbi:hypothetical protein U8607_02710 [Methylobacterium durans]|uniref:HAD family hydrolase n=1 Tax=Methylobacterium durans TaxID=2202825 RepID=UPI002AFF8A83|nr:HAD family hydrolase [Methylobacterium durans]MEA1830981.1 hypothetical protein [Methylobacterium durans]
MTSAATLARPAQAPAPATSAGSLADRLRDRIAAAEAVSFDVFDTLFVRLLASPEDVFDLVGARYGIPDFRRHRTAAQTRAFQVMHERERQEIDLDGIYECLPDLGVPAETLKRAEWEIELAVLRLNPEMEAVLRLAREMGKRCVLNSDMYLPRAFFEELCAREGIAVDATYVSSERQATKRDHGALFTLVAQDLALAPARILHIGDNPASDIRRGDEMGFATFHYVANLPERDAAPDPAHSLATGVSRFAAYHTERSPWWRVGYAAGGPAHLALVRWLEARTRADGIDLLLFLSRDGFTLHRLWPDTGVPSLYFKCSRVLLILASITERNFEENIPFLLSGAEGLCLADISARIGLDLPDEGFLADLGLGAGTVHGRGNRKRFESYLRVMRWRILQICTECRRGLHAYGLKAGLRSGMRIGLVDVGWKGSTQTAFVRFAEPTFGVSVKGYYVCLHRDARRERPGLDMEALITERTHSAETIRDLYANRVVAELCFSAPHGSIIGADLGEDGSVAFAEDPGRGADPRLPGIAAEVDAGIQAAVADLERLVADLKDLPVDLTVPALTAPLLRLARAPSPAEAEVIGSIHNFDSWGSSVLFTNYAASLKVRGAARGDSWPAGLAALRAAGR